MRKVSAVAIALALAGCSEPSVDQSPEPQPVPVAAEKPVPAKLSVAEADQIRSYAARSWLVCNSAQTIAQASRRGTDIGPSPFDLEQPENFAEVVEVSGAFPTVREALVALRSSERTCAQYGNRESVAELVAARSRLETELELNSEAPPQKSIEELEKEVAEARAEAVDGDAVSEAVLAATLDELEQAKRRQRAD